MSTQDLLARQAARPGTSQADRVDLRLAPEYAPLDGRDTTALLAAARALAAHLHHYGSSPDAPDGDWQSYFPSGPAAELAALIERSDGGVQPHLALLIAFFKLAAHPQRLLNRFTARHLALQMQQLLGFVPRTPQPDHAHLVFELKKGARTVEIGPTHRFSAGNDGLKVEQLFAPVRPVVIGAARVEQLRSLHRQGDRLHFAPIAASADGLGAALIGAEPRWPPFGHAALPAAPVGLAVASPVLRLAEGSRSVQLVLQLGGLQLRHSSAALAASLQAHLTGAAGWIGPLPVTATLQGDVLTIGLTLDAAQPGVVDHDPALHLQRFPSGAPVLQLLLKANAPLAFGAFDGVSVRSVQVIVSATGLRRLTLENDAGSLDAKKAFLPFGPLPVVGSRLFIGCAEALAKRLTSVSVRLRWQGAPGNLETWYHDYSRQSWMKNGVSATLTWQDGSGASRSTAPLNVMQQTAGITTLGPDVAPVAPVWNAVSRIHALNTSGVFAARRVAQVEALSHPSHASALVTPLAKPTATPSANPPTTPSAAPRAGFMTLTLVEDFLHTDFRSESIKHLIAARGVVLNEPYTPKVQEIWLDYSARTDASRVDAALQSAFTDTEVQFFHVDAFGISREQAWLSAARPWAPQGAVSLLPAHADAGELLIGLRGLAAGDSVSLLMQVAEGSADPLAAAQTLAWSVLADNAWRTLAPGELALDTSRDLRASGLVVVALPSETSTEHTRLDAGLVWLRASIPKSPRAACDLIAVQANAVEVSFVDQGNHPARLGLALPAGSINKLKTPVTEVKAVAQPFASFGGALRETSSALERRAAERLRHRGRAITPWDIERLVLQAFPAVYRAKCVPHASPDSGLAAGHVMLVVVPDLRNRNAVDRLQPRVDLDTLERIRRLLVERGGMGLQWHVQNPGYRRVRLDFKVRMRAGFAFNHHRRALNAALVERLSPWAHSSSAALDFGGRVVRSALLDFVESQPYVDFVSDFRLFAGDDVRDVPEAVADAPDVILVSVPEHRIVELACDA